jgi:hypothetical protein
MLFGMGALAAGSLLCSSAGAAGLWLTRQTAPETASASTAQLPASQALPTAETPAPDVVPRDEWGALPPNLDAPNEPGYYSEDNPGGWRIYEDELHAVYTTVILHHSVLYTVNDHLTVLDIQRLHRTDRGWADVAYHYFVGRTGTIFAGRDVSVRGVHVAQYNSGCLGVCLLGNFEKETPDPQQLDALQMLVNYSADRLQLTHLATHQDFNQGTLCPGQHLTARADIIANRAGLARGTGGYEPPSTAQRGCLCGDDTCAT